MGLISILLLAVGLCFDSFAVSLSSALGVEPRGKRWILVRFAVVLALFQGIMPMIGWLAAVFFRDKISAYDHWIAFGLLMLLGGKMIWEAFEKPSGSETSAETDTTKTDRQLGWGNNVLLGLATSIDALAAGVAMAMLPLTVVPSPSQGVNITVSVLIISLVTFLSASAGLWIGRHGGRKLGGHAGLLGGVILALLGIKILLEHLL